MCGRVFFQKTPPPISSFFFFPGGGGKGGFWRRCFFPLFFPCRVVLKGSFSPPPPRTVSQPPPPSSWLGFLGPNFFVVLLCFWVLFSLFPEIVPHGHLFRLFGKRFRGRGNIGNQPHPFYKTPFFPWGGRTRGGYLKIREVSRGESFYSVFYQFALETKPKNQLFLFAPWGFYQKFPRFCPWKFCISPHLCPWGWGLPIFGTTPWGRCRFNPRFSHKLCWGEFGSLMFFPAGGFWGVFCQTVGANPLASFFSWLGNKIKLFLFGSSLFIPPHKGFSWAKNPPVKRRGSRQHTKNNLKLGISVPQLARDKTITGDSFFPFGFGGGAWGGESIRGAQAF